MVWGAIIGAGVSLFTANKASKASSKASDQAAAMDKDALEFEKKRYDDWKAVFGDVQNNLSTYYKNLKPNAITARNLEAFEKEKENALIQMRQTFEQRGIATSGLAAQAEIDMTNLSLTERARIRADAPRAAAEEQLGFLTAGLGNDPGNVIAQSKATRAGQAMTLAGQAAGQKYEAWGNATTAVIGAIEELSKKG